MRYREKAILVVVEQLNRQDWLKEDVMEELRTLASSCGAENVAEIVTKSRMPNPAYFIGKGKAEEIARLVIENEATVVIFNEDLSPAQVRNLEKITNVKVIDRTQLILDIFAQRAKSTEGEIQVELAQLEYLLPRLAGRGQMLSRLGGGIGTRGPGEQKLETDRRRIQDRVIKLKRNLKKIRARRYSLRERRRKNIIPTATLVGYTNSGKSTLINTLTGAKQIVKNRLFSTLDPIVRKLILPNKQTVLVADTVGFLHNLPHYLIESFKATLEEVIEADILIHVMDASRPNALNLKDSVYKVLGDLNVMDKPIITVLNKIDKVDNKSTIDNLKKRLDNCVEISALYKKNLNGLIKLIVKQFQNLLTTVKILIPHDKMKLLDILYSRGKILKKNYLAKGVYIEAEVPLSLAKNLTNLVHHKD